MTEREQAELLAQLQRALLGTARFHTFWTSIKRLPVQRLDDHLTESQWLVAVSRIYSAFRRALGDGTHASPRRLYVWGLRAGFVLARIPRDSFLKPRPDAKDTITITITCQHLAVLAALCASSVPDGIQLARRLFLDKYEIKSKTQEKSVSLSVVRDVLHICRLRQHTTGGIDFVLGGWSTLHPLILRTPNGQLEVSFRREINQLVTRLGQNKTPLAWLQRLCETASPERSAAAATLLVVSYVDLRVSERAYEIFRYAQSQQLSIPLRTRLRLIFSLTVDDNFAAARQLQNDIPDADKSPETMWSDLYISSHQGDLQRADKLVTEIKHTEYFERKHMVAHLRAAATAGNLGRTLELWELYRHTRSNEANAREQMVRMWQYVIQALLDAGQFSRAQHEMSQMREAGYQPTAETYDTMLRVFARDGDADAAADIWREMREAKAMPTAISYLQLMVLCARRADPDGAHAVMLEAQAAGYPATRQMYTTLMDACVEAGAWSRVITIFQEIDKDRSASIRQTIEVYNTVLKAYVKLGMPFKLVFAFFRKLVLAGSVKPNQVTYGLLVQSAAETRHLLQAQQLFRHMSNVARIPTNRDPRARPMGTMLAALLPGRAQPMYRQARAEGIELEPWTYGAILRASARRNARTPEQTHRLLRNILNRTSIRALQGHKRVAALRQLYGPVIKMHTKQGDLTVAHKLHQDMIERGGSPSIVTLWLLMDAYRAVGDFEQVRSLWQEIFQLAVKERDMSRFLRHAPEQHKTPSNLLCAPLSTYLHALSAADRHDEIGEVWRSVRAHGFAYDGNNWTVLCVTLVAAGRLDRAYEVLDRILIPAADRVRHSLKKPLSSILEDDLTFAPADARKRLAAARHIQKLLSKKQRRNLLRTFWKNPSAILPLKTLANISPLWTGWKIHPSLLQLLYVQTQRLFRDQAVRDRSQRVEDVLERQRMRATLRTDYPRAAQLVSTDGKRAHEKLREQAARRDTPSWREYRAWLVARWVARRKGLKVKMPGSDRMVRLIHRELSMSKRLKQAPWRGYRRWLQQWQSAWRDMRQTRYALWVRRGRPTQDLSPAERRIYDGRKIYIPGDKLSYKEREAKRQAATEEARRTSGQPTVFEERYAPPWRFVRRRRRLRKRQQPQQESTMFWS